MRIAVPVSDGVFSSHFGQSRAFWVCDTTQNPPAITARRELPMPRPGGCSVIPSLLSEAGVTLVIAGGMGAGAVQKLNQLGIKTITGVGGGTPEQIVLDYLSGQLVASGEMCQHHDGHGKHEDNCQRHE